MKKSTAELRTELADLGVELTEHKHEEEHHVITALLLNAHQTKMDAEKEKRDARKLALKKERDLIKNMSLTAAKKVSLTEAAPHPKPQPPAPNPNPNPHVTLTQAQALARNRSPTRPLRKLLRERQP